MNFDPNLCRNESEVESKLIVQYLLPKLGYSPDIWYQEVTVGNIRLDFLAFATKIVPRIRSENSLWGVILEAKHPKENLKRHTQKLKLYLTKLGLKYGLLTNGREIRIYRYTPGKFELVFSCLGTEVEDKLEVIRNLISRESLQQQRKANIPVNQSTISQPNSKIQPPLKKQTTMKTIAVYHNKGGVGKTTTVINLAAAIRKTGKKVLIIDLDSQANTTFATGLIKFDDEKFDDIKDSNIRHVIESEDFYPILEVARRSQFSNLDIDVVPSHISLMEYEKKLNEIDTSTVMLDEKLEAVRDKYDIVLIDTPPSLNLYARIAIITADYLLIPSDLKPFANQGLVNVKNFVKSINLFRKRLRKEPIKVLGVLPSKISTNSKFVQYSLPTRIDAVSNRYGFEVMDTVIYDREDLAKCSEQVRTIGDLEIADPVSVIDFKPDSTAAQEFELLAKEVLQKIGID